MARALVVEFDPEAFWRPGVFAFGYVASRARRTGAATDAGVPAFPRPLGMALTDPAAILAQGAFHGRELISNFATGRDLGTRVGMRGSKGDFGWHAG
jgi:hypothetical protein